MRLLSSQGEIVRGRCGSTNQCEYCAKLGAVENAELLALDALAGSAPAVWCVLTTRTATLDTRRFYKSREVVVRALRRRWPGVEYAALVEYSTGYGPRSGGLRRPHWNLLLKGVGPEDRDAVQEIVTSVWCAREDAELDGQHVGLFGDAGGLMRYLALHFQKESQRPPEGWRGHRFLHSRGYLQGSTAEARAAARESLAFKRELWRAIKSGRVGLDAEARAREARAIAHVTTWRVVDVTTALTTRSRGGESHASSSEEGRLGPTAPNRDAWEAAPAPCREEVPSLRAGRDLRRVRAAGQVRLPDLTHSTPRHGGAPTAQPGAPAAGARCAPDTPAPTPRRPERGTSGAAALGSSLPAEPEHTQPISAADAFRQGQAEGGFCPLTGCGSGATGVSPR